LGRKGGARGAEVVLAALVGAGCQVPCVDDGLLSMQHDRSCSQSAATTTASTSTSTSSPTVGSTGDGATSTDTTSTDTTSTGTTADVSSGSTDVAPSCLNDMVDGDETDLDCGGPDCPKCETGLQCAQDPENCSSDACNGSICVDPSMCTLPADVDLLSTPVDVLGVAVDVVGDINGDMIDDIVVSAPCIAARTFVVYGDPDLADGFDLETVAAGQGGYVITGAPKIRHVAPAGDFNEDGLGDFAVGDVTSGLAFIVFGRDVAEPVPALDFDTLAQSSAGIRFSGMNVGRGLAGGLDVDGDGKRDVAIGAPGITKDSVFVVSSDKSLVDVAVSDVGGAVAGFQITSSLNSSAGTSVALLPSVDGDALAEVIVGAPNFLGAAGRVFVVFGKADSATVDLDAPGPSFYSFGRTAPMEAYLGHSVAAAGDVNGDGLADVVAASMGGEVFVVFGREDPGHIDVDALGPAGFVIALSGGGGSEVTVGGGPDIDGDGLSEVFIGEPNASEETLWVVFGKSTTEPVLTSDIAAGVGGFALRLDEADADFAIDFGLGDPFGIGAATAAIGAPLWGADDGLLSLVTLGLCPS
jgi:hypothetical protein